MNLTIREGVNKDSKVLKHKIALEAITLLEDKDLVLDTEVYLYAMIALVDNFIEESLVELVGQDERTFADIVEAEIEPKFNEIVAKYELDEMYEELVYMCIDYKDRWERKNSSALGLIDTIANMFTTQDWSDLKFFFRDLTAKGEQLIAEKIESGELEIPKKTAPKATQAQLDGASDKMAALIEKFQREGKALQEQNKTEEIKVVEESNE